MSSNIIKEQISQINNNTNSIINFNYNEKSFPFKLRERIKEIKINENKEYANQLARGYGYEEPNIIIYK